MPARLKWKVPQGCDAARSAPRGHGVPPFAMDAPVKVWGGTSLEELTPTHTRMLQMATILALQPHIGRLTLNYYGGTASSTCIERAAIHRKLECTAHRGMKGLFWKVMFTPAAVANFSHVWFFDSDVEIFPFALLQLIDVMRALSAAIGQPSVAKPSNDTNARSSTGPLLQHSNPQHPLSLGCVAARVNTVEVMTPVFEAPVWAAFHDRLVRHWPDSVLGWTVWELDQAWCGFAARALGRDVPCIVSRITPIIHTDTRMMDVTSQAAPDKQGHVAAGAAHRRLPTSFGLRKSPVLDAAMIERLLPYSVSKRSPCRGLVIQASNLSFDSFDGKCFSQETTVQRATKRLGLSVEKAPCFKLRQTAWSQGQWCTS